jgi:hypothetical protein
MLGIDLNSAGKLVDGLGTFFYVAMAAALLTVMMGSPGWAFLMLVLGSCALVVRTTLELCVVDSAVRGRDRRLGESAKRS